MTDLTISIVNYNTKNLLKQCIKNICSSHIPICYEIVIIDNNSKDESVEFIERNIIPEFPRVKLISSEINRGFGQGYNWGLKNSSSKYLLIINADIVVLNNAIEKLYQFIEQDARRAIVGPQLIYPDFTLQRSAKRFPRLLTPLYSRTTLKTTVWGRREMYRYEMRDKDMSKPQQVEWLVGACMLIRKNVWDQVGGFDPRYFLYYEDIDLCRKVRDAGYEVWYYGGSRMIHYHKRLSAQTSWWKSIFNKVTRIHIQSHFKYFEKWKIKNQISKIKNQNNGVPDCGRRRTI